MNINLVASILVGSTIALPVLLSNRPNISTEEVLCRTGTRIMTPEEQDSIRLRLTQAGLKLEPEYLCGLKALLAGICLLFSLFLSLTFSFNWLALILLAPAFYLAPQWWLDNRRRKRQGLIAKALSDFSRVLSIVLSAGTDLIVALENAAKSVGGPLKDEIELTIKDHNSGKPLIEALFDMAARTDVDSLNTLIRTVSQAYTKGAPLAEVMEGFSANLRIERKHESMDQAGRLSVKMVPIVLLFILIPTLIVIGYPAVVSLMQAF